MQISLDSRKHNLPIGPHVIKLKDNNGRTIILQAAHGVSNKSVNHILLCIFKMKELRGTVDDFRINQIKSIDGEKGT